MKRHFLPFAAALSLLLTTACSQTDQERAKAEAERAAQTAKRETKELADKTKDAASEISDKTKSALNDSDGAAAKANEKLRDGMGDAKEAAITAKVKSKIAADAGLSAAADVSVETEKHTVTLTGKVASEEKRREVEKAALGVDGVTKVDNRLTVR